jgi:Leucine-rich repeat (LRR) protein
VRLQTLELSHSNLPAVANLGMCSSLTSLNLSHNRIGSLTGLREVPPFTRRGLPRHSNRCPTGMEFLAP